MKRIMTTLLLIALCGLAMPALGQAIREDAIWARVAPGPITLDGVLDEAAWSQAETKVIDWATDSGVPGSGWKSEGGWDPVDPTHATLKFLVVGNQLYMGAVVQDRSIGGSAQFNRFDGFLMAIKDHFNGFTPSPPFEYLYSWWHDENVDPQPPGQDPGFIGVSGRTAPRHAPNTRSRSTPGTR